MNIHRILLSLAVLVFAGGAVAGGTGAFFSDEETSTGNIFTAGALDLKVDSESHYNNMFCEVQDGVGTWQPENGAFPGGIPDNHYPAPDSPCKGTWTLTDLGPTNTFFSFSDLKPGDHGENTLSLHVFDNDAYACAVIDNMVENDNGLTEPEGEDGDTTGGAGEGELSQYLHFFAWDDDGDNIWEEGETPLFSNEEGPASDVLDGVSYPLFTPATEVLSAEETQYLGLYWCFGDITVNNGNNTITCDGSGVNNVPQTDSMSADISFYVEQARNNENFVCPEPETPVKTPTIAEGATTFENSGGVRYRELLDSAGEQEVFLGKSDLGNGANRVAQHVDWANSPASTPFTFTYDSVNDKFTSDVGAGVLDYLSVTTNVCEPGNMDKLQVFVRTTAGPTVTVSNLTVDGTNLGNLAGTVPGAFWTVSNIDLTDGLTVTGTIDTTGVLSGSNEGQKVELLVGCSL